MKKYMIGLVFFLLATNASAQVYPLKPFDSLFVRGNLIVTAKQGHKNQAKAKLTFELQPHLQVVQVKKSVFVQLNPFKKLAIKHPLSIELEYTLPLKRVTALQGAKVSVTRVNAESLRVSGSGQSYIKVTQPGKVKKLLVHLTRKSVADLSPLRASQCELRVGEGSHVLKRCEQVKEIK